MKNKNKTDRLTFEQYTKAAEFAFFTVFSDVCKAADSKKKKKKAK